MGTWNIRASWACLIFSKYT